MNAQVKVAFLVGGMIAGADSIDDMGLLRHGAMPVMFGEYPGAVCAGLVPGLFHLGNLFTWGTCCSRIRHAGSPWPASPCWPGADVLAFIDIDSQQERVYQHAKQGAVLGFSKIQAKGLLVRGLNVLAATISTPLAAPVIVGTRRRGGNTSSARGAASMVTEAVSTSRAKQISLSAPSSARRSRSPRRPAGIRATRIRQPPSARFLLAPVVMTVRSGATSAGLRIGAAGSYTRSR
jgi:hypothetical protein